MKNIETSLLNLWRQAGKRMLYSKINTITHNHINSMLCNTFPFHSHDITTHSENSNLICITKPLNVCIWPYTPLYAPFYAVLCLEQPAIHTKLHTSSPKISAHFHKVPFEYTIYSLIVYAAHTYVYFV